MKKVFFGLPCYNYREQEVNDTIKALLETKRTFEVTDIREVIGRSAISCVRNDIAKDFLKSDADYLFFLDSDNNWMFEKETEENPIDKMIFWNKDIISPPMVTRIQPIRLLYWPMKKTDLNLWDKSQPFQVFHTGAGFTLITRECIEKVSKKFPIPFCPMYDRSLDTETSDDVAFMRRARSIGFSIWICPGIKIGHIGKYAFSPEDIKDYLIEESKRPIKF